MINSGFGSHTVSFYTTAKMPAGLSLFFCILFPGCAPHIQGLGFPSLPRPPPCTGRVSDCTGDLPEPLPIFCVLGIAEIMVSTWFHPEDGRGSADISPISILVFYSGLGLTPAPRPPPFLVVFDPVPRSLGPQGCWAWCGECRQSTKISQLGLHPDHLFPGWVSTYLFSLPGSSSPSLASSTPSTHSPPLPTA